MITVAHAHTETKPLKIWFLDSGDLKAYKSIKSPFQKFDPKTVLPVPVLSVWVREK